MQLANEPILEAELVESGPVALGYAGSVPLGWAQDEVTLALRPVPGWARLLTASGAMLVLATAAAVFITTAVMAVSFAAGLTLCLLALLLAGLLLTAQRSAGSVRPAAIRLARLDGGGRCEVAVVDAEGRAITRADLPATGPRAAAGVDVIHRPLPATFFIGDRGGREVAICLLRRSGEVSVLDFDAAATAADLDGLALALRRALGLAVR